MNEDIPDEAQLSEFCERWALNEDAVAKLRSLPQALQQRVVAEFDAPPHMTEVNGKFILFCVRLAKEQQSEAWSHAGAQPPATRTVSVDDPVLAEFVETWSLNDRSVLKLQGLLPELQQQVIAEFVPPAHVGDVNETFFRFCKRVERSHAEQVDGSAPGDGVVHEVSPQHSRASGAAPGRKEQFNVFRSTPCSSPAEEEIYESSPPQREPPAGGADEGSMVQEFAIQGFCAQWSLNEAAVAALRELPPQLQRRVMAKFSAPPGTRSVSGRLLLLARHLAREDAAGGDAGGGSSGASVATGSGGAARPAPRGSLAQLHGKRPREPGAAGLQPTTKAVPPPPPPAAAARKRERLV